MSAWNTSDPTQEPTTDAHDEEARLVPNAKKEAIASVKACADSAVETMSTTTAAPATSSVLAPGTTTTFTGGPLLGTDLSSGLSQAWTSPRAQEIGLDIDDAVSKARTLMTQVRDDLQDAYDAQDDMVPAHSAEARWGSAPPIGASIY